MPSRATMIANALRPKQAENAPDVFSAPKQSWADYVSRETPPATGYEGMPAPQAEGMPTYDPNGAVSRIAGALATMPTVQSIKSGLTLPGDVYAGRQPMGLPSETEDLSRVADLAGLAMTGGIGGVASGAVPKEAVGIFGGKLAKTANHEALATAETLAQKGADPAAIWKDTGWFKGTDGKWRFEIDDSTSRIGQKAEDDLLGPKGQTSGMAAGVIHHKELYDAYPDLRKIETEAEISHYGGANRGGGYMPSFEGENPSMSLRNSNLDAIRSTGLHELQHGVQALEGFASGSNPHGLRPGTDGWEIYKAKTAEALKIPTKEEWIKQYGDNADSMENFNSVVEVKREYNKKGVPSWLDGVIQREAAEQAYKRQAGEVEARNVQTRRDMTPEERAARPPWETQDVPNEQQLLNFRSDGMQASSPIRAYHGSPHDFDKFDLSKIGTGEGAQAYGHGLYFAEKEGVAKAYRDALGKPAFDNPKGLAQSVLEAVGGDPKAAVAELKARVASHPNPPPEFVQRASEAARLIDEGAPLNGRMYEVAIHADPERFLDWDKPLGAVPPSWLNKALKPADTNLNEVAATAFDDANPANLTGRHIHQELEKYLGGPEAASQALGKGGIPGIKYLDQGSRGGRVGLPAGPYQDVIKAWMEQAGNDPAKAIALMEEHGAAIGRPSEMAEPIKTLREWSGPTSNYVLFDDKIVEILRKYGVGSIAALPPAVQMAIQLHQDQTQAEPQEPTFAGKASKMINDLQRKLRGSEPPATPLGMGIRG